jgi:hypothetical protein
MMAMAIHRRDVYAAGPRDRQSGHQQQGAKVSDEGLKAIGQLRLRHTRLSAFGDT